jgi:hypothetical protein
MIRLTLVVAALAAAACTAGPTTGETFGGTTQGAKLSFFGWTDMQSTAVTSYIQTKPYCNPVGGAFTSIGSTVTASTPTSGMNDARNAYYWSFTSNALSSNQWKQGGLARFKTRSKINGSNLFGDLAGFDTDGPGCAYDAIQDGESWVVAGQDCQSPYPNNQLITVASTKPLPAEHNFGDVRYLALRGGHYVGENTPLVTPASTVAESSNYYASIGAPATLAAFKSKYGFGLIGSNEVRAVYYNVGDLGIGRDMRCKTAAIGGGTSTACYVSNYGRNTSLPFGAAGFGAKGADPQVAIGQALAAQGLPGLSPNAPVATVAMVHDSTAAADRRVQFMVYDQNGQRSELAPLDNLGLVAASAPGTPSAANLAVPDNCLSCHGASSTYTPATTGNSVVHNARFLPFDPDAFLFSTSNPSFSKDAMLPKLKQLNALVWDTGMTASTQELLMGMYPVGTVPTGPKSGASTFDPNFIPTGWKNIPESRAGKQLYTEVVKPFCRTCHVSHDALDWNTYQEVKDLAPFVAQYVCNQNSTVPMPQAEQVQSRMWATGARAHLMAAFTLSGACTPVEAPPASPVCP